MRNIEIKYCFEVIYNDDECVVLEAKLKKEMDLFILDLDNVEMIRMTKGEIQKCTLKYKNGKSFSWYWGIGGRTLVSDSTRDLGYKILHCIEYEFGIPVSWRHTKTDSRDSYFRRDRALYHQLKENGQRISNEFEIGF